MRWVRIVLILGCVLGGIAFLVGGLGLAGGLTDPTLSPSDRNDTVLGAVVIMGLGLAVLAPCMVALIAVRPGRAPLPAWQPGAYFPAAPPAPSGASQTVTALPARPDLAGAYLQWFGWCQREIGGDEIALHAATMAALAPATAGDAAGAQAAARQAAQWGRPAVVVAGTRTKTSGAKVKLLAAIGAATLPLLEAGERALVSFHGTDRQAQMWQAAFGLLGFLVSASQAGAYYVTVTDRRLIALAGAQLRRTPDSVAFAVPRSMVTEAKFRKSAFGDSFALSRVTGERNRFVLSKLWRAEAGYAQAELAPGGVPTPLPATP